jgi:hypothetical protein
MAAVNTGTAAVNTGPNRASRVGGLNHVAVTNPNAVSAPIGMSASGLSGKHLLAQNITVLDHEPDMPALVQSAATLLTALGHRKVPSRGGR